MPATLDQKLVAISGFLVLCSVGACIAGVASAPAAARSTQTEITTVDRVNKGDQLTVSPVGQAQQKLAPPANSMKTSLQRPPLGCDPAFSPVADPTRAGVYKRCTV
jgi:endonuclease YncB( thermonuclease family)